MKKLMFFPIVFMFSLLFFIQVVLAASDCPALKLCYKPGAAPASYYPNDTDLNGDGKVDTRDGAIVLRKLELGSYYFYVSRGIETANGGCDYTASSWTPVFDHFTESGKCYYGNISCEEGGWVFEKSCSLEAYCGRDGLTRYYDGVCTHDGCVFKSENCRKKYDNFYKESDGYRYLGYGCGYLDSYSEGMCLPYSLFDSIISSTCVNDECEKDFLKQDLNGDYKINIRDVARASKAFGSYPGDESWDPICDINDDGKVDIRDIASIASAFGTVFGPANVLSVPVDKDITFTVNITNVGRFPQGVLFFADWLVGIDFFKVKDYTNPYDWEEGSNVKAVIIGTSEDYPYEYYKEFLESNFGQLDPSHVHVEELGIGNYISVCYDGGIPIDPKYCNCTPSRVVFGKNDVLTIKCMISKDYWARKWCVTNGNERVMTRVFETLVEKHFRDTNRNGRWDWYEDALTHTYSGLAVTILTDGRAEITDVKNVKTDCGAQGEFNVTINNTGTIDLYDLTLVDNLYIDKDGDPDVNDREVYDTITKTGITLLKGETKEIQLKMNEDLGTNQTPFYFHVVTLKLDGKDLYKYGSVESLHDTFRCGLKKLTVNAIADPTGEGVEGVYVWIKDSEGNIKYEGMIPSDTYKAEISLEPGIYSILVGGGNRPFSHFRDHDCDETNEGLYLDTDENPYVFEMYPGRDREITVVYKGYTYFYDNSKPSERSQGFNYNGTHIYGWLLDEEDKGILNEFDRNVKCGVSEPSHPNLYVDLYYEKDGKWHLIGSVLTDYSTSSDKGSGYFSYPWKCIPGVTKLKAVYEPKSWHYVRKEHSMPFTCDLDVKSIKVGNAETGRYYSTECKKGICNPATCEPLGSCPSFECNDNVTVRVEVPVEIDETTGLIKPIISTVTTSGLEINKVSSISYDPRDVNITLDFLVVNEETGSNTIIVSETKPLESSVVDFIQPSLKFANMPEGHHLGFRVRLKGKIKGTDYWIDFPAPKDDSTNPPPRIDNSRIYSVSCCPHLNFWCDKKCEAGKLCNCTLVYTHDEGESGKIHLHWKAFANAGPGGNLPDILPSNCEGNYVYGPSETGTENWKYVVIECDVANGESKTISFKPSGQGILKVYARARDNSMDEDKGEYCEYSLDPLESKAGACRDIEFSRGIIGTNVIGCTSKLATIDVESPEKLPDLVISDIFSSDNKIMYEIANRGGAGAFPSKTSLTIDGNFVATHDAGFLLPGDVIQYAFTGVNWRDDYCTGATDSVNVKVCADHLNDVDELNETNNCMVKDLPCCTPTSEVEICDDMSGTDEDCDGYVNCADPDCRGANDAYGHKCCQSNADCDAFDTDGGIDEFEMGTCTPYTCSVNIHICQAQPSKTDGDVYIDDFTVREYYPSGNECEYTDIHCPEGYGYKEGKCIPIVCQGEITLSLIPDRVNPSGTVTPVASGLKFCEGKNVYFDDNSDCSSPFEQCTIGSDGNGCTGSAFNAPSSEGTYTYYACVDKNGDNDFDDPGEKASATLEVVSPVYILNITPREGTYVGESEHEWVANATDNSSNVPESVVTYFVWYDTEGECHVNTTVTPPSFPVPKGGVNNSAFKAHVKQSVHGETVGIPCRVLVKLSDVEGHVVAHGTYQVCNPENTDERCADGIDNDCDGYVDCEDSDCWGYAGCCGSDADCSNTCTDSCSNCEYGGGYVEQNVSTCDLGIHKCVVETNVYYDSWDGNVDDPNVTYYECSGNDVVANWHQEHDSCDVNSKAVNWYWDASENKLKKNVTYNFTAECYGKTDGTYAGVREPICIASDGTIPDTIVENLTDCMEAGACYCSEGSCVSCGADEYCDNYQCIPSIQHCDELCASIPPGDISYIFYSACRNRGSGTPWEVNTTSNCTADGSKECYCYMKCEPYDSYQCPKTWAYCHFGATYPGGRMGHYFPSRNTTYKEDFKIREASDLHNLFVNLTYDPSQGDYDLYVKWSDVCPDPSTYDCGPGSYYEVAPGKKVCYKDNLPSATTARVAVYNSTASQGKYNISINSDEIKYEIKEGTIKIERITTPFEETTTTTLETTTVVSTWRQIQLGILEFIRKLFRWGI